MIELFAVYLIAGMIVPLILARYTEQKGNEPFAIFCVYGHELLFIVGILFWPIFVTIEIFANKSQTEERKNEQEKQLRAAEEKLERTQKQLEIEGQTATVVSILRPFGLIEINGRRIEAKSESGMIQNGTTVLIKRHESGVPVVSTN